MNEFPMMFPYSQAEFWEKMTNVVEKVVEAKLTSANTPIAPSLIPERPPPQSHGSLRHFPGLQAHPL